jgi:hypothetical protein
MSARLFGLHDDMIKPHRSYGLCWRFCDRESNTDQEVVRLDIVVDQRLVVDRLDARDLYDRKAGLGLVFVRVSLDGRQSNNRALAPTE